MKKFIFNIINNTIKIADNKKSLSFLAIFSFFESIIIPIPPDIFLVPIALTKRYKWFFLGIFTTVFSIWRSLRLYNRMYFGLNWHKNC